MAAATKNAWHAVTIVPCAAACDAAQQLRGRRFLARAAPRLPLAGCTNHDHCQCKYQHYADRRGDPRRNADSDAGKAAKTPAKERRRPGERRERRS
jgi:hypothetical protein